MNATDDEKLVRQYQQGDQGAFRILFQRHYRYVYKVFVKKGVPAQDAEDFTQDLFLKLTEALLNFSGHSRFKTYLHRALTHKLIDFYRRRRVERQRRSEAFAGLIEAELHSRTSGGKITAQLSSAIIEAAELGEILRHCMKKLTNPACRAVVALWLDGFKLRQIAQILALPRGTVNSHQTRGRAALKRCLEERYAASKP